MINRTPMTGMQSRAAERQHSRSGGENVGSVQYGRNPQGGTAWNARPSAPARQSEVNVRHNMPHPVPMAPQEPEIGDNESLMERDYQEPMQQLQPVAPELRLEITRREPRCQLDRQVQERRIQERPQIPQRQDMQQNEEQENALLPETLKNTLYVPGYLRTQIGKTVQVEFLLGNDLTEERVGTLIDVGANYILLQALDSQNVLMCDVHSVKFVTVIEERY